MLTLLIIQDLTDSTREAAWAHGVSTGPPALPSGLKSLRTDTAFGLLRTVVKNLPSGIVFDSGRHVSLWSLPCFDVTQSATFLRWPNLYHVLAPLSAVL